MKNRIKQVLKEQDKTVASLAEFLGMKHKQSLSRIINGRSSPRDPDFFEKVADFLKVPVFRLLDKSFLFYRMNAAQASKLNLELSEYTINQLNELSELREKIEEGNFLLSKMQAQQSLKNMCDNLRKNRNA